MKKREFTRTLTAGGTEYMVYDFNLLESKGIAKVSRLPFSIKILIENLLRKLDGKVVLEEDLVNIANWKKKSYDAPVEIPYHPARVLMQDLTGVPAVVDLAAMRDAMKALGGRSGKDKPAGPRGSGGGPFGAG